MKKLKETLTRIVGTNWGKAKIRNGVVGECRCSCRFTCKPRCIVNSGDDLLRCLAGHYVEDCDHQFSASSEECASCGSLKLSHQASNF